MMAHTFEIGERYNIDFVASGNYEIFLKHLLYEGEYIASNLEVLHVFWSGTDPTDLISIQDKKIKKVYLERRAKIT
jgi:hypothetical protein